MESVKTEKGSECQKYGKFDEIKDDEKRVGEVAIISTWNGTDSKSFSEIYKFEVPSPIALKITESRSDILH